MYPKELHHFCASGAQPCGCVGSKERTSKLLRSPTLGSGLGGQVDAEAEAELEEAVIGFTGSEEDAWAICGGRGGGGPGGGRGVADEVFAGREPEVVVEEEEASCCRAVNWLRSKAGAEPKERDGSLCYDGMRSEGVVSTDLPYHSKGQDGDAPQTVYSRLLRARGAQRSRRPYKTVQRADEALGVPS